MEGLICRGDTFPRHIHADIGPAVKFTSEYLALLPCLQTIRVSDGDSRTVIGRTRHVTSPIWNRMTGLPV